MFLKLLFRVITGRKYSLFPITPRSRGSQMTPYEWHWLLANSVQWKNGKISKVEQVVLRTACPHRMCCMERLFQTGCGPLTWTGCPLAVEAQLGVNAWAQSLSMGLGLVSSEISCAPRLLCNVNWSRVRGNFLKKLCRLSAMFPLIFRDVFWQRSVKELGSYLAVELLWHNLPC